VKIFVTGGAGFIGSQFVRTALSGGYPELGEVQVTVFDSLSYAGNLANLDPVKGAPGYEFIKGDITDLDQVNATLPGHDAVVHFAAESHVDRSISGATPFILTNVLGTQVLLEAALRHGVAPFVHVSTDEVYGSIPEGSWPETDPLRPNSPYAASKASSDLVALAYHRTHGLDVRITRCSNNYGPYQHPEKVIPLFVTNLIENRSVPLYGDGQNVRDWLHVDDHCQGIEKVLRGGRAGEVYNIGGGTELTNRELTDRLLAAFGKGEESIEYVEDRLGHDRRYSVDWSKIRDELGYTPKHDFDSGLADTIDWFRGHESWWRPLKHPQT
jgi:dTDP-glucose 4,6-dehydratase